MRSRRESPPAAQLRVGGLIAFSTVDYPGRLSAVLFCQGCAWRCRYCHNPHLQRIKPGLFPWEAIKAFLRDRRGLLDAVVFSGGEPTGQPALASAMRLVRGLGFRVGLHTAGVNARRLREVLPLVDWVGLDVKAPFDARYETITGRPASAEAARESLAAVLESGVDYELRTTVHPDLLDEAAREDIRRDIDRAGAFPTRWQEFRPQGCADVALLGPSKKGPGFPNSG